MLDVTPFDTNTTGPGAIPPLSRSAAQIQVSIKYNIIIRLKDKYRIVPNRGGES
jgi:hypothetical protein